MNTLEYVQASLIGATEEVLAYSTDVSPLQKRTLLRIEKRRDQCTSVYYCRDGYHCISDTLCKKDANYAWTGIFGVLALVAIILFCLRRRRAARSNVPTQQSVVVTNPNPSQYAPPPGDPNLAYQTPTTYPPQGSPYPEKPLEAPPAAYSPYPTASNPYPPAGAYPPTSGGYPPASGGYPSGPAQYPGSGTPYMAPYNGPASAPYPVPGEAASYAPPK